jgi:hypothetical protein
MARNLFGLVHTMLDDSGALEPGGTIEVYQAGTTTAQTVYSDRGLTTTAGYQITADAAGRLPERWIGDSVIVKLVYRDSSGATLATRDYANDNADGLGDVITQTITNNAALTALTSSTGLSDNGLYQTLGRVSENDGGQGLWLYDSASTTTADGGTVLAIDGGGAGRFFRLLDVPRVVWVQWFGDLTTASGFTAAWQAATTAAGVGGTVNIPYGAYSINGTITPLAAQQHIGHGKPFITKTANVTNLIVMTQATRTRLQNLVIFGGGSSGYTGKGVYIGADALSYEQEIVDCLIDDFSSAVVHFDGADAGQRAYLLNSYFRRTTVTDPAIVGTASVDSFGNRQVIGCWSNGATLIQFNKMINTLVSGCNFASMDFSGSEGISLRAKINSNRVAHPGAQVEIYGNDTSLTGNVIASGLILKGAASRNRISGNSLLAGEVVEDESTAVGDNVNEIDTSPQTVNILLKATSDPALWATLNARVTRRGRNLLVQPLAIANGSTTFGTGDWYFQLPAPFNTWVAKSLTTGLMNILDSGSQYYTGTLRMSAGSANIFLFVTQGVNSTHPMTWATGDTVSGSIEFEIS